MGSRTRGSLSLVELERRRLQAADLFEQGVRRSRIAEVFGVTRQAVHVWHRAWEEGGRDALLSRGPGGSSYLTRIRR
jgi:transposase